MVRKEDIPPREAQAPRITFGDGVHGGIVWRDFPIETKEGWRRYFLIEVSKELKEIYNLKGKEKDNHVLVSYPTRKCITLSNNPFDPHILILCGFDEEETQMTLYYDDVLQENTMLRKQIKARDLEIVKMRKDSEKQIFQPQIDVLMEKLPPVIQQIVLDAFERYTIKEK